MSSGSAVDGVVRLAEIRSSELSVDEVIAAVRGAGVGGIVVFIGTVRDEDHSRAVTALDYSAHTSAAAELLRVVTEVGAEVAECRARRLAPGRGAGSGRYRRGGAPPGARTATRPSGSAGC